MKPDDPPPGAPATPEAPPTASLTNVRLRGRSPAEPAAKPPVKRGDLTQQLQAEPPAAPPPEPPRTAPKRGDLTQQLEAAARKAAGAPSAPPAAPPPKVKDELLLERKPAKAEPAPAPQPKTDPLFERKAAKAEAAPAPQPKIEALPEPKMTKAAPQRQPKAEAPVEAGAAEPVRDAEAATPKAAAPAPKVEPPVERKPAAVKGRFGQLAQDEVDALFADTPPAPRPAETEAVAEPEAPAPSEPPAEDPHANIPAGTALGADDVRALLDPPGRRRAAAAPPVAEEAEEAMGEEPPPAVAAGDAAPEIAPTEDMTSEEPHEFAASDEIVSEDAPPAYEAPDLHLVVDQPLPAAEPEPAAAAAAAAPAAGSTVDAIIDYWDSLRGDRAYPMVDTIDRAHISGTWPNCLLVAFASMTGSEAVQPRMTRLGEANGQVEYTAMVIDWIIRCGRQSVKRGEPMEEEKRFPVTGGNARYQLLLLPLSSHEEGKADYVLAHLVKVKELSAGAAFKRWLAS